MGHPVHHILDWTTGQLACETRELTPSATSDVLRVTCPACRASKPVSVAPRAAAPLKQSRLASVETEKQFMARVIDAARRAGWRVYHTYNSRQSAPGFPDLVVAKAGERVLFIECKTDTGRMTPTQQAWIDLLDSTRGEPEAHVWRPQDWTDIVSVFQCA